MSTDSNNNIIAKEKPRILVCRVPKRRKSLYNCFPVSESRNYVNKMSKYKDNRNAKLTEMGEYLSIAQSTISDIITKIEQRHPPENTVEPGRPIYMFDYEKLKHPKTETGFALAECLKIPNETLSPWYNRLRRRKYNFNEKFLSKNDHRTKKST
jgi:hypothetical protein